MRYTRVEAIWPDETCYIVASGPSLRGFDFTKLDGRKVIVINSSVFAYPTAPVHFFGDARWWGWNGEEVRRIFKGHIFTACEITEPRIHNLVKRNPAPYVSLERGEVSMRRTSLTATINLAVHFGCKRLILLGADQKADQDGRTHHHDPHPIPQMKGCWDVQLKELRGVGDELRELGIEVINTSLGSRINWWPKQPIEELL